MTTDTAAPVALVRVGLDSPPAHVAQARQLLLEYATMPHTVGLWPTAAADAEALPLPHVHPQGALYLALMGEEPAGMGALSALPSPGLVELKRVYVREAMRGRRIGEALTRALLDEARALGFSAVRLDTMPVLVAARTMYERLGFVPIPPYKDGLLAESLCYELRLGD